MFIKYASNTFVGLLLRHDRCFWKDDQQKIESNIILFVIRILLKRICFKSLHNKLSRGDGVLWEYFIEQRIHK